ncbi:unnamed protein product, partial [Ceratitis capitata]
VDASGSNNGSEVCRAKVKLDGNWGNKNVDDGDSHSDSESNGDGNEGDDIGSEGRHWQLSGFPGDGAAVLTSSSLTVRFYDVTTPDF